MPNKLHGHCVLIDTREQQPCQFSIDIARPNKFQIASSETVTLDTGDYSLRGYEHLLRIERKSGFHELFTNLVDRTNRERFIREMERLAEFKYKYILVESNINTDIMTLGVPQMRWGPPASKILKDLLQFQLVYGVQFHFVGDAFEKMSRYIFEMVVRFEK